MLPEKSVFTITVSRGSKAVSVSINSIGWGFYFAAYFTCTFTVTVNDFSEICKLSNKVLFYFFVVVD